MMGPNFFETQCSHPTSTGYGPALRISCIMIKYFFVNKIKISSYYRVSSCSYCSEVVLMLMKFNYFNK